MTELVTSVARSLLPVVFALALSGTASALDNPPAAPAEAKSAAAPASAFPDPQEVSVNDDTFTDAYFGMSLKLPSWKEGLQGPPPSLVGNYVLDTFDEPGPGKTSLLIGAQDTFFGAKPFKNAADMTEDFRTNNLPKIPHVEIEKAPATMTLAGHEFQRIDYNAGGLYRTWLAADLRCHVLLLNFTGTERADVEKSVKLLDDLKLAPDTGPLCVKGYVTRSTVTHVVVVPQLQKGLKVPVRVIIGPDGNVRHVHVIRAPDDILGLAIAAAIQKWQFKPYLVDGKPTEIETGVNLQTEGIPD